MFQRSPKTAARTNFTASCPCISLRFSFLFFLSRAPEDLTMPIRRPCLQQWSEFQWRSHASRPVFTAGSICSWPAKTFFRRGWGVKVKSLIENTRGLHASSILSSPLSTDAMLSCHCGLSYIVNSSSPLLLLLLVQPFFFLKIMQSEARTWSLLSPS